MVNKFKHLFKLFITNTSITKFKESQIIYYKQILQIVSKLFITKVSNSLLQTYLLVSKFKHSIKLFIRNKRN